MRQVSIRVLIATSLGGFLGCTPAAPVKQVIPSVEYSNRIKAEVAAKNRAAQGAAVSASARYANFTPARVASDDQARAQLRFVGDAIAAQEGDGAQPQLQPDPQLDGSIDPGVSASAPEPQYREFRSSQTLTRDYTGPLSLGDPGVAASLWHESRSGNELFRDDRAWQPMDLITIIVSESSEGKKEADADVKQDTEFSASIENLLGAEKELKDINKNLSLESLIKASASNSFKADGSTNRKDSLKARISAMVAEVLPTGILRIEGERIISVNSEEQVMVISGLVRTRDINSNNEVDSSKIANMRIDYYGRGLIGEAMHSGWLGRAIRVIWPF